MVDLLSKATGEGRITLEEFADAAGAAYAAVTRADLDRLYRSLHLVESLPPPPDGSSSTPSIAARTPEAAPAPVGAAQASGSDRTDNVIAIMSGAKRNGRWTVRRRTRTFAFWGSVHLDLRDAVIESEVVEIGAWAIMGGVNITVPEGIPVEMSGCMIMGGRDSRIANVPPLPGAPVVRVKAGGFWGGVCVRSRPSRRVAEESTEGASSDHGSVVEVAVADAEASAQRGLEEAGRAIARASASLDRAAERDVRHPQTSQRNERDRANGSSRDRVDRGRDRDRRVNGRRPGNRPEPQRTSGDLLTVVCTDIVGSTRHAVALGDQRWHAVLAAHNLMVRDHLGRFGGTEVKTSGDGFLITFTSARAALQFALELQDALAAERTARPEVPIELRIGVHAGEVERDGADVIGRNVTIACRLCDAAAPGEVLASAVVADLADSASDLGFGPSREHSLAGIEQPLAARPTTRA